MVLDRTDRKILGLLQEDARISNKELAAAVSLAPSTCHTRVQRLVSSGVLRGFHADVDPRALGVGLEALVSVQLTGNPQERLAGFAEHARAQREVVAVYQIAGKTDLLLHVAVRDVAHMRRLIIDTLSSRPEVREIESALVYEHTHAPGLPDLA